MPDFAFFTLFMAVHALLHWFYSFFARTVKTALLYFAVQTVLAVFLVLDTGEMALIFGLYLPLLGEEVGIFRKASGIIIAVLFNCLLIAGSFYLRINSTGFNPVFYAGILTMTLFVIIYVNLYSRQIEAKNRAEKLLLELEQANNRLAVQNSRIEQLTKEQERQRIARELHDTLAQGLSGLILQLEAASVYIEKENTVKAAQIVNKAMGNARETLSEARSAIDGLRVQASSGSLYEYISGLKDEFSARGGMRLQVNADRDAEPAATSRNHLIRIVSEAISNSIRHSGADTVKLSLRRSGKGIRLLVSDNGKGFDPSAVPGGHYGLKGIRERCRLIGAVLEISSGSGGTVIAVDMAEGAGGE